MSDLKDKNFNNLKRFCSDYSLIAIRYSESNRWDLATMSGEWGYTKLTSVSDTEISFVPWRIIEKRLMAVILELAFGT